MELFQTISSLSKKTKERLKIWKTMTDKKNQKYE
jgi:hypothetical protein